MLAQVSGTGIFPEVELSWATFNQVQRLIQKTAGKTCVCNASFVPSVMLSALSQCAQLQSRGSFTHR